MDTTHFTTPGQFLDQGSDDRGANKKVTASDILGVPTEQAEDFLAGLLSKDNPRLVKESRGKDLAAAVPRSAVKWLYGIIEQTTDAAIDAYLDHPPKDSSGVIKSLRELEGAKIVPGKNERIWRGLDRLFPGWAYRMQSVIAGIAKKDTKFLAYLEKNHEKIFKDDFGIIPSPEHPGRWKIDVAPRELSTSFYTPESEDSGWKILIDKIWTAPHSKEGQQIYLASGAEQLIECLGGEDIDTTGWLWGNVEELRAYLLGDESGWLKAARLAQYPLNPEVKTHLGAAYLEQATEVIFSNRHIDEDTLLEIARGWLDVPLLTDRKIYDRLVGKGGQLERVPGINAWDGTEVASLLLGDQKCATGYLRILGRPRCWAASDGIIALIHDCLGYDTQDFPDSLAGSTTSGLIEAAMMVGKGNIIERLLADPRGVAAVQHVLDGPSGPSCLIQMGAEAGWQALSKRIAEEPEAWNKWRDRHGNTITHWLSFGQNQMGDSASWLADHRLFKAFPQHLSIANDRGNEPTKFMGREHANKIAAKLLKVVSVLTPEEKKAKPYAKARKI